jgi:methylated-DNA-protein-cysteine methyltransferase-like protein
VTLDEMARAVAKVVKAIPRGQVLSYSQVALRAGMPGNPRGVVRALHTLENVPWWRVIRSDGTVAPQMGSKQLVKLKAEGHAIKGRRVRPTGRSRQSNVYPSITRPPK